MCWQFKFRNQAETSELKMKSIEDDIRKAIDDGKVEVCQRLLTGLAEKDRRAVAPVVIERLKHWSQQESESFKSYATGVLIRHPTKQLEAARISAIATFSLSELKKHANHTDPRRQEYTAADIILDRNPDWLNQWCEFLLKRNLAHWPLVWQIAETTNCDFEEEDFAVGLWTEYLNLIRRDFGNQKIWNETWMNFSQSELAQMLFDRHPKLIDHVWPLFEFDYHPIADGGIQYSNEFWAAAIPYLVKEKKLSRERVLELMFDCLARDLHDHRAKWLCLLHEKMELTEIEKSKYQDVYLTLLESRRNSTIKLALDVVKAECKSGRIDIAKIVEHLEGPLRSATKAIAKLAISFLKQAERKHPTLVLDASINGFLNPASEIQDTCIELLKSVSASNKLGSQTIEKIRNSSLGLEPSCKKSVDEWLLKFGGEPESNHEPEPSPQCEGTDGQLTEEAERLQRDHSEVAKQAGVTDALQAIVDRTGIPEAIQFDIFDVPFLRDEKIVRPVENREELIDVLLYALEHHNDLDELERGLSGIARLPKEDTREFRTLVKPLEKRARQILNRRPDTLHYCLCLLILAWIADEEMELKTYPPTKGTPSSGLELFHTQEGPATGSIVQRFIEIARATSAGKSLQLMSSPTHSGGWIDPIVLVERANQLSSNNEPRNHADECFSLLRLAPDNRLTALRDLKKSSVEYSQALRYALDRASNELVEDNGLHAAASRARHPMAQDPVLSKKLGKDYSGITTGGTWHFNFHSPEVLEGGIKFTAGCLEILVDPPASPNCKSFSSSFYTFPKYSIGPSFPDARWLYSHWPAGVEIIISQACNSVAKNVGSGEVIPAREHRPFLEKLLDPDVPMSKTAMLTLVIALSARQTDEQGPATEALISCIQDARIDSRILSRTLFPVANSALFFPGRTAKCLLEVGRVSPLHNLVIANALEELISELDGTLPKDFHHILETLLQLLSESNEPIRSSSARSSLENVKSTGKTKALINKLLELDGVENEAFRQEALSLALEERVARAKRWIESSRPVPATAV